MGGQIDVRADAAIVRTPGAAVGRELATLIRRLAAVYDGQRPVAQIGGPIWVCTGELPQARVRSGLVSAAEALTGVCLDRRLQAGAGMPGLRQIAVREPPGARRPAAGFRIRPGAAAGEGRCRAGAVGNDLCRH